MWLYLPSTCYPSAPESRASISPSGKIVLTVGFSKAAHGEDVGCTVEQKKALDRLHLDKIDLADEVLILNVGGYIGESTRCELNYARLCGKVVHFLEPEKAQ